MAITLDGTNGILSPDFEPSSSTTPTNGLFLPAANTVGLATGSTERLRIDSSGNLGLGVTPSGWGVPFKAIEGGDADNQAALSFQTNSNAVNLHANSYYNGGYKYKFSGAAGQYVLEGNTHAWYNAPSGTAGAAISFTQAMTLDASGNLGVGTTSPTGAYRISLTGNGSSVVGGLALTSNGNTAYIGQVGAASADCEYWNAANGYVRIGTNNTERARIDSSGNLLVGTTSQYGSAKVSVNGFVASSATGGGVFYTNNTINEEVAFASAKSILGGAYVATDACIYTGKSTSKIYAMAYTQGVYLNTSGTSWTSNSDERLKTDLKPIENAAQKVSTLRAVTGRYKTDKQDVSRSFLIAQDVQAVLPEAVDASDPDKLGVQYTDTIPLLVAAIKELTTRLEALENK